MLTQDQVGAIIAIVNAAGANDTTVQALRHQFTGTHFTYCADDDLPNHEPVASGDGFNIYLVDGHAHCMALTNDYAAATGLVVAEVTAAD